MAVATLEARQFQAAEGAIAALAVAAGGGDAHADQIHVVLAGGGRPPLRTPLPLPVVAHAVVRARKGGVRFVEANDVEQRGPVRCGAAGAVPDRKRQHDAAADIDVPVVVLPPIDEIGSMKSVQVHERWRAGGAALLLR